MFYKIKFEVDDGVSFTDTAALVHATGRDNAKEKLSKFINAINSETCISKFYSVEPFEGEIFTEHYGCI